MVAIPRLLDTSYVIGTIKEGGWVQWFNRGNFGSLQAEKGGERSRGGVHHGLTHKNWGCTNVEGRRSRRWLSAAGIGTWGLFVGGMGEATADRHVLMETHHARRFQQL